MWEAQTNNYSTSVLRTEYVESGVGLAQLFYPKPFSDNMRTSAHVHCITSTALLLQHFRRTSNAVGSGNRLLRITIEMEAAPVLPRIQSRHFGFGNVYVKS